MSPLNHLMNSTLELANSKSIFKRHVLARAAMVGGCLPLEILAIAQNVVALPYQLGAMAIKIPAKLISLCLGSKSLKEFEASLPGPVQLIKTALKVVAYALGTFLTATLGIFSPKRNFSLHVALELIDDQKALAETRLAKQLADKLREDEKLAMQAHIQKLVVAMRKKLEPGVVTV